MSAPGAAASRIERTEERRIFLRFGFRRTKATLQNPPFITGDTNGSLPLLPENPGLQQAVLQGKFSAD